MRILFVDDEPGILHGLRNALRRQREVWEMAFVASGADALAEMARGSFDLVVTDMRMPGMDGAELLARVKSEYPATARIVLSGYADREAVLRALPVAQQYLTKPCDAEHLRAVIERTCHLNAILQQPAVRQVIGALDQLPSAPTTYLQLTQAMSHADVDIRTIAAIIERDLAMSVKVLQLINSAYFGLGRSITSIRQAVSLLGLELLQGFVLSAHIFSTMDKAQLSGLCLDQLQEHSTEMARALRRCVGDGKLVELALTAALVHDVGEIVFALGFGPRYAEIADIVRRTGVPCHVAEEQLFGVSHAEVGAYLLGTWGLPMPIVEVVAYHHRPGALVAAAEDCRLLAAMHVVDALSCGKFRGVDPETLIDHSFLKRVGVAGELDRWRAIAAEEFARTPP